MRNQIGTAYDIVPYREGRFTTRNIWLLGTVNDGMIMCEGICTRRELEEGKAIERIGKYARMIAKDEYKCFKWYIHYSSGKNAGRIREEKYIAKLRRNPEKVYLTLEEVAEIEEFHEIHSPFTGRKKSEEQEENKFLQMVLNKQKKNEEEEEYDTEVHDIEDNDYNCAYYCIQKKDKSGKTIPLKKMTYFSQKKIPTWAPSVEETLLTMLALREANELIGDETWKGNPWMLKNELSVVTKIYKEDGNGGRVEIIIFPSRERRSRLLNF